MSLLATNPERPVARPQRGPLQAIFAALGWGVAAALVAGTVWGVMLLVARHLLELHIDFLIPVSAFPLKFSLVGLGIGTACGFCLGAAAAMFRQRGEPGGIEGSAWGAFAGLGVAATAIVSPFVAAEAATFVPREIASGLCFAVWGLLAGSSGYVWSRWTAVREHAELAADEEDEPGQPPGAGTAWAPDDAPSPVPLSTRMRSLLRLSPVVAVSLASLIASAVIAPSNAALALLGVGLLGLALLPGLCSQEDRLAAMERRLRRRRKSKRRRHA